MSDEPSIQADPMRDTVANLVDRASDALQLAARHHDAIRHLMDRVEFLENLLYAYAKVKGDGDLLVRLGRKELARQNHPDRVPPPWPKPAPPPPPFTMPERPKPPEGSIDPGGVDHTGP